MFYATTTRKCLPRIFVLPSFRHITDTKNPCVLVLTRCHVTDINHVLTPCHVIEINYVDRGVAARTPLQCFIFCLIFIKTTNNQEGHATKNIQGVSSVTEHHIFVHTVVKF